MARQGYPSRPIYGSFSQSSSNQQISESLSPSPRHHPSNSEPTQNSSQDSEFPSTSQLVRDSDTLRGFFDSYRTPGGEPVDKAERATKRRKTSYSLTQPGRGIRKICDLYHDLPDLLGNAKKHAAFLELGDQGIADVNSSDFSGMTEDEIDEERREQKRCYDAVKILNNLIPNFEQKASQSGNIYIYCSPFQLGASDARSDDTSRLKAAVANWINKRKTTTKPLCAKEKDGRGICNDITGGLLCPIGFNWEDLQVRANLRNAAPGYDFSDNFFIRCLYENEKGDPSSPEVGFLKGPLLLQAFRHIFTSPSSALNENSKSEITSRRRDVASMLRMNYRVTPRSIAYTATQLVFSLNTLKDWKLEYAGFHYPAFYNFIVDYFDDNNNPRTRNKLDALLRWWNSNVFPPNSGKNGPSGSCNAVRSSRKILEESRACEEPDLEYDVE